MTWILSFRGFVGWRLCSRRRTGPGVRMIPGTDSVNLSEPYFPY